MTEGDTLKTGGRYLIEGGRWMGERLLEVTVMEFSPSGEWVRLKYTSGYMTWVSRESVVVVEELRKKGVEWPAPSVPRIYFETGTPPTTIEEFAKFVEEQEEIPGTPSWLCKQSRERLMNILEGAKEDASE